MGPEVMLCPTGGIGRGDLYRYVAAGASGFGLGGALFRPGRAVAEVERSAHAFVSSWRATQLRTEG